MFSNRVQQSIQKRMYGMCLPLYQRLIRLEAQANTPKSINVTNQCDILSFNESIKAITYKNSFTVINGKIKYNGLPPFDIPSLKKIKDLLKDIKEGHTYRFIEILNGKTYVMNASLNKNIYNFTVGTIDKVFSIVNQYSILNRNLNKAASLLPMYIDSIETTKNATTFLKQFTPLTYFFCFNLNTESYLFHQKNTKWNGEPYKNLYIGDIRVSEVADKMILEYNTTEQFLIDYVWTSGYKVSFANIITHKGNKYWLGTGIDLIQYITPGIKCKGDVQINGNFTLEDNNANIIYSVDNVQKNIVQLYKVGIGELYPESTLDIKDSSTQDILTLIKDINKSDVYTTQLLSELKNASMDSKTVKSIVERVCPVQTIDLFYVVFALEKLDKNKITYLYFYPFPNWTDKNLPMLRADPTISQQLVDVFEATATTMASTYAGDGLMAPIVSKFVWGEKRNGIFYFTNKNKLYALATGKNVQNLNLKVNTNVNFSAYFSVEDAYQYYLQSMLISIKNIQVINLEMLKGLMKDVQFKYTHPLIKYYDIQKETVAFVTYSDKITLLQLTQFSQVSFDTLSSNERHKELSFINNIKKEYQLEKDTYGMISYEDDTQYFMSQFYVIQDKMVLAVELPIETYLKPTLNVIGDSRLQGEVQVYDKSDSTQYTTIDPANHYFGINSDKRMIQYSNDYTNNKVLGENLAQHHAYITSNHYPNLVCEVTNGTSAATMKLASNKPFSEMGTKELYGPDISFEIEDSTEVTREVGTLRMGVDSANQIGFGVSINTNFEGQYQEKQILSVDNTGCLSVNSIKFGNNNSISVKDGNLQLTPSNKLTTRINQRETIETFYPFSMKNKTSLPMVTQYTIQLPDIHDEYVYSLSISMEYTEYRLNDIESYYFKSHFTYDSSWTDKEIPNTPFTPTIYSCGGTITSVSNFVLDYLNHTMTITITLPPNVYIVSSATIKLGQIYPMDKTLYDFDFFITRTI